MSASKRLWKLKWSNEYSRITQAFSYRLHGIESASVRAGSALASRRRRPSKRGASGTDRGLSLGQATYWLTAWSCWVECILIWLPSKSAICPVERVQPPPTWGHHHALGQGHLALQLERAWLFKVPHGEGSRGKRESSSEAWVWWAVLSCLPKKNEMMPPWRCFCACTQLQKIVSPQHVKLPKIN